METEDGVLLTVYQIKCKSDETRFKPKLGPLLLVHGFSSDADSFVRGFTDSSLPNWAVQMAEQGYDVYIANLRGTQTSKGNTNGQSAAFDDELFWNFDNDTVAQFDIPALVKHVIKENGRCEKVTLLGDSNGAAITLKALADATDAGRYI